MKTGYIITLYVAAALTILAMPNVNRFDTSAMGSGVVSGVEPEDAADAYVPGSYPSGEPSLGADEEAAAENVTAGILLYRSESGETEEIPLEDYVLGVVAAEMPVSFGKEALKAQAVAARSYVAYRIAAGYKHGSSDAAICDSYACCAAYISPSEAAERWGEENADAIISQISSAIAPTQSKIVTYNGNVALTVWHSNSCGQTKSAVDVWGGTQPYLISVSTMEDKVDCYGGHGVGMSQYGAAEMAERGFSFEEILAHYYPGTSVGFVK